MTSPIRTAPPPPADERERVVGLLRAHADAIRRRGVTRLALFGSTARGKAGPKSDVSLLIEELDPASRFTLFDLIDLQDELGALLGRPVHFAFGSALRPWLREEVLRRAVPIF